MANWPALAPLIDTAVAVDPDEQEVPWNDPRVAHLWSTTTPILSPRDEQQVEAGARELAGRVACLAACPPSTILCTGKCAAPIRR
jgi:hypothetical protein